MSYATWLLGRERTRNARWKAAAKRWRSIAKEMDRVSEELAERVVELEMKHEPTSLYNGWSRVPLVSCAICRGRGCPACDP